MAFIFTRRDYRPGADEFTNSISNETRYAITADGARAVKGADLISKQDWVNAVKNAAGSDHLLFMVHGCNVGQRAFLPRLERAEDMLKSHGFRGAIVGYDWPADGLQFNYRSDMREALAISPYLVLDGIAPFLNVPGLKVHVMGHSLGAYLTLNGFARAGDAPGSKPWDIEQVMLHAGDVDAGVMRRWGRADQVMSRRCTRLTSYHNLRDMSLAVSRDFFNGKERAGHTGLPSDLPDRFEDVSCTDWYDANISKYTGFVNAGHAFYFQETRFFEDAWDVMQGKAGTAMATRAGGGAGDWRLV